MRLVQLYSFRFGSDKIAPIRDRSSICTHIVASVDQRSVDVELENKGSRRARLQPSGVAKKFDTPTVIAAFLAKLSPAFFLVAFRPSFLLLDALMNLPRRFGALTCPMNSRTYT